MWNTFIESQGLAEDCLKYTSLDLVLLKSQFVLHFLFGGGIYVLAYGELYNFQNEKPFDIKNGEIWIRSAIWLMVLYQCQLLVLILYCSYVRCYYWRKLDEGYVRSLFCCNFLWICNYFKIKSINKTFTNFTFLPLSFPKELPTYPVMNHESYSTVIPLQTTNTQQPETTFEISI